MLIVLLFILGSRIIWRCCDLLFRNPFARFVKADSDNRRIKLAQLSDDVIDQHCADIEKEILVLDKHTLWCQSCMIGNLFLRSRRFSFNSPCVVI